MKSNIRIERLRKMAREGRIELQTDPVPGYAVEIRWTHNGKREFVWPEFYRPGPPARTTV